MFFYLRKNTVLLLIITLALFCSACVRDNSWQIEKSYAKFESMLAHAPNNKNQTKIAQDANLQQDISISLAQKTRQKNSIKAMEDNSVLILTDKDIGSGFFVAPNIIVTNKHVVQYTNTKVIVFGKGLKTPRLAIVIALSNRAGKDYAILKMVQENSWPSGLALCAKVGITEKVSTWGFPLGMIKSDPKFKKLQKGDPNSIPEIIYSEGIVNVVHNGSPKRILHTAKTAPGSSGGPLTNADYCIVGMNTLLHGNRKTSIAFGIEDIVDFLRENEIKPISYTP